MSTRGALQQLKPAVLSLGGLRLVGRTLPQADEALLEDILRQQRRALEQELSDHDLDADLGFTLPEVDVYCRSRSTRSLSTTVPRATLGGMRACARSASNA